MEQKIGVVTIYDLDNYGNRLQNYATIKYLNSNGYSAETLIVDYVTPFEFVKNIIKKILGKNIYKDWNLTQECQDKIAVLDEIDKRRYERFYRFTYSYMPPRYVKYIGRFCLTKNVFYDKVFVGSDQVWNPTIAQASDAEFLRFVSSEKRVAWAASFGINDIDLHKERIIKGIKGIPYISVREESGKKIIKELCGKNVDVLIDPTLLLDEEEWGAISIKPENIDCECKFILTYFLGRRSERVNNTLNDYKKIGYKIYNLLDREMSELYSLGPAEFLYLLSHAELVLTDSFHACVFSFIFDKPFIVYSRNGKYGNMMSRIETLLNTFDLTRKYIDSGLVNDVFEHDYSIGKRMLVKERKKVHDFLKTAMKK